MAFGSDLSEGVKKAGRELQQAPWGTLLNGPGLLSQFSLLPVQERTRLKEGLKLGTLGGEFLKQYLLTQGAVLSGNGKIMSKAANKMKEAAIPLVAAMGPAYKSKMLATIDSMQKAAVFTQAIAAQLSGMAQAKGLMAMGYMLDKIMPTIAKMALLMQDKIKQRAAEHTLKKMMLMARFIQAYNEMLLKVAKYALPATVTPKLPPLPDKGLIPDDKVLIGKLYEKMTPGYFKLAKNSLGLLDGIYKRDFSSPTAKLISDMDNVLGVFGAGTGISKLPDNLRTSLFLLNLLQANSLPKGHPDGKLPSGGKGFGGGKLFDGKLLGGGLLKNGLLGGAGFFG